MTILNVKYRVLNNKNDTVKGIDQGNIEEMVIEKNCRQCKEDRF